MKKRLLTLIPAIFFMNISTRIIAQAKLVMNGDSINITNVAVLVIDNPDNTAITYNGSGYIQSEGMNDDIIWNISRGNGNNYLIPFRNASLIYLENFMQHRVQAPTAVFLLAPVLQLQ